jgi:hypothetical protein
MLRSVDVKAAISHMEQVQKQKQLRELSSAVLLGHGVAPMTQETLFKTDAPVSRALIWLGRTGLGSKTTITENISNAVGLHVETDVIKPTIELVLKHKLPFSTILDGSSTKAGGRKEAEVVFMYHPLVEKPFAVDWVPMNYHPNALKLVEIVRSSITGVTRPVIGAGPVEKPYYMSDEEYTKGHVMSASDHASTMVALAEQSNTQFCGDPGHATALVMKAICKAFGIAAELKLHRTVLLRKNSLEWAALLKAFGLDPALFAVPATRWAYISRLLRVLSDTDINARLQQLLLHCLSKAAGGETDTKKLLAGPVRGSGGVAGIGAEGDNDGSDSEAEDEALPVAASVKKKRDDVRLAKQCELLTLTMDPEWNV